MSSERHAAAIYRDLEKLYRLIGLYKGNLRQIEQQLRYLDNNLDVHLRSGIGRSASVRFDLLMSAVYYEGEEIFRSTTPEFTLSYALFGEGVKSIILRSGLSSQELADWLLLVRSAVDSYGKQDQTDLASLFWRKSTPNIRVALYNNLISNLTGVESEEDLASLEFSEDEDEFDELIEKEVLEAEFGGAHEKAAHKISGLQEDAWDIPSGDIVVKKMAELGIQDPQMAQRLRRELGDAQVSDRAKRILRFSKLEIEHLRKELEHFDESQVEYNLLLRYLFFLENQALRDPKIYAAIVEDLAQIIQSTLSRFHGGLILFLLKRIEKWQTQAGLEKIYKVIESKIFSALQLEKNLVQVAFAFEDEKRQKIAKELLKFLGAKQFQFIMSVFVDSKEAIGVERFLEALIPIYPDLEHVPQIWQPEEIGLAVPFLSRVCWEARDRFLARCLRSRNFNVAAAAGEKLAFIQMEAHVAIRLYQTLDERLRLVWLQSLARNPPQKHWVNFMRQILRQKYWQKESNDELMALWIRCLLRYLGKEAIECFSPWVRARRFYFWPRYPKLREIILQVAMRIEEASLKADLRDWALRERGVLFQSKDLKELLAGNMR